MSIDGMSFNDRRRSIDGMIIIGGRETSMNGHP
jgi:hypothetical protein